jgi:hypothetical protein
LRRAVFYAKPYADKGTESCQLIQDQIRKYQGASDYVQAYVGMQNQYDSQ